MDNAAHHICTQRDFDILYGCSSFQIRALVLGVLWFFDHVLGVAESKFLIFFFFLEILIIFLIMPIGPAFPAG